ncbi:MAG: hypothetical protein UEF48_04035 [Agathobaculum butyriciproducens]|jgi:predicted tellurium resistance membrane protein TerC|nr:hypothetical protein [Butyricicoccus sp. BIOML-A1]MEE0154370.1 hypothetical protein [Agathobaculum butyriciproducens]MZT26057.1 hypothetical protein [Butyricicoccus sp. BIOML-A1]
MKHLIYGGILIATGVLGMIASLLICIAMQNNGWEFIPVIALFFFVFMIVAGYFNHIRPETQKNDSE